MKCKKCGYPKAKYELCYKCYQALKHKTGKKKHKSGIVIKIPFKLTAQNFRVYLGISIPVAIVIAFFAQIGGTVFFLSLGYAAVAGMFWSFAKYF